MANRRPPTQDFRDFVGIFAGLVAVGGGVFTALTVLGVESGYALSGGLLTALLVTSAGLLYLLVREQVIEQ